MDNQCRELEEILREQYRSHPQMELVDFVKLVYQNEFGSGHVMKDRIECRDWIVMEGRMKDLREDGPLAEPIGNGLVRIHLGAARREKISVDQLTDWVIQTSRQMQGSREGMARKLEVLKKFAREDGKPFTEKRMESYLAAYAKQSYPPVHHSRSYRKAYVPHYRVVLASLAAR